MRACQVLGGATALTQAAMGHLWRSQWGVTALSLLCEHMQLNYYQPFGCNQVAAVHRKCSISCVYMIDFIRVPTNNFQALSYAFDRFVDQLRWGTRANRGTNTESARSRDDAHTAAAVQSQT